MSMPTIHLNCDKCGYSVSTTVICGSYSYLVNEIKIPLKRKLGWCNCCNSFSAIEYFNDDLFEEIINCRDHLEELQSRWILNCLSSSRRKEINSYQKKLIEVSLRLHIISERKGDEKCLSCGSNDILLFDGDYSLEYDIIDGLYKGTKKTGFIHPNCGGEFIAIPSSYRIIMGFTPKYYDKYGILIPDDAEE